MTSPLTFTLTTRNSAIFPSSPPPTCCDCDAPAPYFLDIHDDEFCAALCAPHALFHIAHILTDAEL